MIDVQNISKQSFKIERDCRDKKQWDAYIHRHPSASNYHRYGWRDVVEKSFRHKCFYMAARDNGGSILGVLPLVFMQSRLFGRFLISLPFFNYGGVLYDRQEVAEVLLSEAVKLQSELGAGYTELRHQQPLTGNMPTKQQKVAMLLDLAKDEGGQWEAFNAKLRNLIRKAMKCNLTVTVGGKESLSDFYTIFVHNMRDLGTPVYSKVFFQEVLQAYPDHSRIITVYSQGKAIASGLINWFRDTVEIPWASSIREYNALCPNILLYWTALQYALSKGFTRFDFGRSTPGEGTYNFKKQWGAKPIQLNWQYLLPEGALMPQLNTKNPKYEMAIKVWQKLPLSITRVVGPHIVRSIP